MLFSPNALGAFHGDIIMFQSPKTGLCFSHLMDKYKRKHNVYEFQSPKTGLCFSHMNNKLGPSPALALFQSPKMGLYYFHSIHRDPQQGRR